MHPDSTNATWFLMADHSSDRTRAPDPSLVAGRPSSFSAPEGVRPVYAAPRRRSRRAASAHQD